MFKITNLLRKLFHAYVFVYLACIYKHSAYVDSDIFMADGDTTFQWKSIFSGLIQLIDESKLWRAMSHDFVKLHVFS